ncbi:hypothetical protein Tco_1245404 [Tanacetum coccineum]
MSDSSSYSNMSDLDDIEDIDLVIQLINEDKQVQGESSHHNRKAINRERDVAEARLMADYFEVVDDVDQIVRWSVFEQRSNSRLNQMNASSNVEELNQMNASSNVEQLASESKAHLSIAYIFYPKEAKNDNTVTVDTSENGGANKATNSLNVTLDWNVTRSMIDTFKATCGNSNDMCDDLTKHPNQTSTSTSNTSIDSIKGPVSSGNTTGPVSIAKFSKDEINAMIENDPWLIRNVSLILKKWTPNANIMKEDVCTIPVNLRSMKRVSSYARATIDLQADVELKDTILVAIPKSVAGLTSQEVSNSNLFDALNTVENHDKPGTNEGNSKLAEKGENSHVVSSAHGTSAEAFSTPNTTV